MSHSLRNALLVLCVLGIVGLTPRSASAATIEIIPPNPTTEDSIIVDVWETAEGCEEHTGVDELVLCDGFECTYYIYSYFDFNNPTCPDQYVPVNLADTVGPLPAGIYSVTVLVEYDFLHEEQLPESAPTEIEYTAQFEVTGPGDACDCGVEGDMNGDGEANPVDLVYLMNLVYQSRDALVDPPNCPFEVGDVNYDGTTNPVDMVCLVNLVFFDRDAVCHLCGQ